MKNEFGETEETVFLKDLIHKVQMFNMYLNGEEYTDIIRKRDTVDDVRLWFGVYFNDLLYCAPYKVSIEKVRMPRMEMRHNIYMEDTRGMIERLEKRGNIQDPDFVEPWSENNEPISYERYIDAKVEQ